MALGSPCESGLCTRRATKQPRLCEQLSLVEIVYYICLVDTLPEKKSSHDKQASNYNDPHEKKNELQ